MIVYDGLKSDFLRSVQEDTLAEEIEQCVLQRLGRHTVQNEFMSWVNSYNYMYKVLNDPGIPENAGVAIEYNIPQTAKRVDFMISGYDAENHPDMVIAELTQENQLVQYTSKNSAPRQAYAAKLKGEKRKSSVTNMFKGSGSYVDVPEGMIDTILADEYDIIGLSREAA